MNCRITNLRPPCAYNADGIAKIWLLDSADFKGYRFDTVSAGCLVTDILRVGPFIELEAPDMVAKYNFNGSHMITSFIPSLAADIVAQLQLGTKRRQVVLFLTNAGKYHAFGSDAGAVLGYQLQTADGAGSLVSLVAASRFPLYEVTPEGANRFVQPVAFRADFENGAYCEQN